MSEFIQALSVAELFGVGAYKIPLYQRNYAWGEAEIEQLLRDILDMALCDCSSTYYLGTLVVWRRPDEADVFETIDGQQRHTTLSLILAVLKNEYLESLDGISQINLHFDGRPGSERTLARLFNTARHDESEEPALRAGYEIAKRYLSNERRESVQKLSQYLLANVRLLRAIVPHDTDLNHYFEIMNNRGEQLEKHEVLKARLLQQLDVHERTCFARVWEACAEMNRYVQLGLGTLSRARVFGEDWNDCPADPDALFSAWTDDDLSSVAEPLHRIIALRRFHEREQVNAEDVETGAFNSIISFPNFLLQVLRATTGRDIPLDDKQLLSVFDSHPLDPRSFILDLLKCRLLFDRFIIKRSSADDWSLQSLKRYATGFGYVNSIDNEDTHQQLIMLQSMFHVSFPAQVYKHWLNASLRYLWQNGSAGRDFLAFLETLSSGIFYGRFGRSLVDYYDLIYNNAKPDAYFDTHCLNQGTLVQNFVFNRLDYLLWKAVPRKNFPGVEMDYIRSRHKHFKFTFRSSVEHFYPQQPIAGQALVASEALPAGVDNFGNLCLISHDRNSKLSNHLPKAKKDYYQTQAGGEPFTESLKQAFMMSYADWGPEYPENITAHAAMMVEVLLAG
ncbi:DUF262 domain-containing protein [Pseudomonas sp. PS01303]|uniref:DUF262 domain-containing protein n=1 Tax=Pseudomonas sp. PS01303 TaxID=2991439 RepID=UPI002499E393|nr:DUF262 domain-containing protein [Pseudomonas sp. PS01303]